MTKKKYTDEEIEIIVNSKNKTIKELAKILDRPYNSVKKKIYSMQSKGIAKVNVKHPNRYTEGEKQFIIDNPKMSTNEMCKRINRGRNSLIVKRLELTPNFERRRRKVKLEPDGFNKTLNFIKDKGFKNTHEAIAHYGSINQFKQAIKQ